MSPVTHDEALASAVRLIDHYFGNDAERVRASIPARLDHDDDLLLCRYIKEQRAKDGKA